MKYRKKPVIIDAEQWLGSEESFKKILSLGLVPWSPGDMGSNTFYIKTLEGDMIVRLNDWVLKGVRGEFYPCNPKIFALTYEEVLNGTTT